MPNFVRKRVKRLLLLLLGCLGGSCAAETLVEHYSGSGQLIITQFASAPFPHPMRAEGHKYHGELFAATDHYSDSSVAIFIPKGLRETGKLDFVVHFHGWRHHIGNVLPHYQPIEQLIESKRNAILIIPQGPYDAPDSFGGKLEDPGGFERFMAEVMATLRQKSGLQKKAFVLGNIILSGHSGGYQAISSILDRGGLTDHVAEVWLFDALYAHTDEFQAWFDKHHGRFIDLYTEHGGTKDETEKLMAALKQRGTSFFAGKEGEAKPAELQSNRLVFVFSELPHDDVLDKHRTFRGFLEPSCLGRLD
jgi:hypothetical protein